MFAAGSLDGVPVAAREPWAWQPVIPGHVPSSTYWDAHPAASAPPAPASASAPAPPAAAAVPLTERPPGQSPGRLLYREEGPSSHIHTQMSQPPPFFPHTMPAQAPGWPGPVIPQPDFGHMRLAQGMPLMQFGQLSMVDNSQLPPFMMNLAPNYMSTYPALDDRATPAPANAVFDESWPSVDTSMQHSANIDDLLALSRQAQLEAGGDTNVFVCPHCQKRYVGRHARSIWRRHLQDKHSIPLSVQPRRTRWDRDANRPRNAEERRERMLESKRRWARKKREQERMSVVNGESHPLPPQSENAPLQPSENAPPQSKMDPPRLEPPVPTPNRPPLASRDMNTHRSPRNTPGDPLSVLLKSPGNSARKYMSPLRGMQRTPLRDGLRPSLFHRSPRSPVDLLRSNKRPALDSARRNASSRAALATLARAEPSPRIRAPGSIMRRNTRLFGDTIGSPSRGREDQFSSPQHLNLTQSLGLAPHSASKGSGYSLPSAGMTPMAGGTPFSKLQLGLTPLIGGLLRGTESAQHNNMLLNAGDLSASGSMLDFGDLDTPSADACAARDARAQGLKAVANDDDEDDEDKDPRGTGSPLGRPSKALFSGAGTPTKVRHSSYSPRPHLPPPSTRRLR